MDVYININLSMPVLPQWVRYSSLIIINNCKGFYEDGYIMENDPGSILQTIQNFFSGL